MQLLISRADLNHALSTIAPAIASRSSHPILDCVHLAATGDSTLTLTGFNLDLGITIAIPASIDTSGAVCLPYRLLSGIVGKLPDDAAISLHDGLLSAAGASYRLATHDPADYPDLPVVDAPEAAVDLTAGVAACMACCSTDHSKAILQGIHLSGGHMEATDGHRMMRLPVPLPDGINLVLPATTMRLLAERSVSIAAAGGHAVINAGDGITIYSRILDGTYPNVAALIPESFKHQIVVNRRALAAALDRVAIIADGHNSIVKLTAREGQLDITAETDASNGCEVLSYDGTAKGAWAFNVHYLLTGLKAFRGHDEVTINANSATTPVVMRPTGDDDVTYLVMPVQIRS
jgi:DNA polymerase-3 subunit beta